MISSELAWFITAPSPPLPARRRRVRALDPALGGIEIVVTWWRGVTGVQNEDDPCLWWSMVSISYCFWCFWSVSVGCLWFPRRLERFHDGFWGASWSKHRGCRSFRGLELPGFGGLINRFKCRFMPLCISYSSMPFSEPCYPLGKGSASTVQLLCKYYHWWSMMSNYDQLWSLIIYIRCIYKTEVTECWRVTPCDTHAIRVTATTSHSPWGAKSARWLHALLGCSYDLSREADTLDPLSIAPAVSAVHVRFFVRSTSFNPQKKIHIAEQWWSQQSQSPLLLVLSSRRTTPCFRFFQDLEAWGSREAPRSSVRTAYRMQMASTISQDMIHIRCTQ